MFKKVQVDFRRCASLPFAIFVTSLILILLAVAEFLLQTQLGQAFRNLAVQYPNSSLAEWRFVSFNPDFIDDGTSISICAAATFGLIAGGVGIAWAAVNWWRITRISIKRLGIMMCIISSANAILSIGFMIYISVSEAKGAIPEQWDDLKDGAITREYYVCTALPFLYPDAERLFGFPACDVAKAGRYELFVIVCVSAVLAAFSIIQVRQKRREWNIEEQTWDPERRHGEKTKMFSNVMAQMKTKDKAASNPPISNTPWAQSPATTPVEKPAAAVRAQRSSLYGYYQPL
ncbi:hypothetical protein CC80DRAFT_588955 [Byssothecium circinans]|uniref:Uncharacterized protein n=1 Tax=Byssothecium circinans TaxID=147558 RepID=A0A6A5UEP4_9PLEO|nr:hypothetical protein CC80DRAFT_588955 [Byssothecium circinans]